MTRWSRKSSKRTSPRKPASSAQRRRIARSTAETGRASIRRWRRLAWSSWPITWFEKTVWLVGGDGWAYDIGFGGLDHVLSMRHNINILVLDTEVYSNTGGQASKSTPSGAAAKFAASGKGVHKKDLGLMAMSYGHVYVASVAFGAKDTHTVQAIREAESFDGPAIVIAYSHCIAHGYDLRYGADQQKLAVNCGIWPLYRFDPRRIPLGEPPLLIDAPAGRNSVEEYCRNETRFGMVAKIDPGAVSTTGSRCTGASLRARCSLRATVAYLGAPNHAARPGPPKRRRVQLKG